MQDKLLLFNIYVMHIYRRILFILLLLHGSALMGQDSDVQFTILTPELDREYSADVRRLLEGELTSVNILSLRSSFKIWKTLYQLGDEKWDRAKLRLAMVKNKIEALIRIIDGYSKNGDDTFYVVVYDDTGKVVYVDQILQSQLERKAEDDEGITAELIADHFTPRLIAFFVDWDDRAKVPFELPPEPEDLEEEEGDEEVSGEEGDEDFDISQFYGDDVAEETGAEEDEEEEDVEEEEDAFDEDTYFEDYEDGYDVASIDKLYPTFMVGLGGAGEYFAYSHTPGQQLDVATNFPFIKGGASLILETWVKHEKGWAFGVEAEARGNMFLMGEVGYGNVPGGSTSFSQQTWLGQSIRGNLILRLHNLKNYDGWGIAYGFRAGARYFLMLHNKQFSPRYLGPQSGLTLYEPLAPGQTDRTQVAPGTSVSPLPYAIEQIAPTVGVDLEIPILVGPRRLRLAFQTEVIPWALQTEEFAPGDILDGVWGFYLGGFFRVGLKNGWFLDFRATYLQTRHFWRATTSTVPNTRRGVSPGQDTLSYFNGGNGAMSTAHAAAHFGWEF